MTGPEPPPPGPLPILNYHAIDATGVATATDPGRFARTIDRLLDARFVGVDLAGWVEAGRPAVSRGFAVTFDDGYASIRASVELMARRGVPATVFLVADRVGLANDWTGQPAWVPRAGLLDREQIADLAAIGARFGSHGRTHARLDRLGPAALLDELRGSRDRIEAMTGRPCRLLAYPYGLADGRVRRLAASLYDAAFGTRLARASRRDDPFDLPRVDAYYLRSGRMLRDLVAGAPGPRLAVRRALRAARGAFARSG